MAAVRNLALGLPAESGATDVDRLYELRGRSEQLDVEQVTAGVDVQVDRLVRAPRFRLDSGPRSLFRRPAASLAGPETPELTRNCASRPRDGARPGPSQGSPRGETRTWTQTWMWTQT